VWGNHSCRELATWVHCHNCPVLHKAGRSLFNQTPPGDYLEEWGALLAEAHEERAVGKESLMIFRLGAEWLGLRAGLFQSIEEQKAVHRIPHRSNKILLGLVNIQGGLQLCISLRTLPRLRQIASSRKSGWRLSNGAATAGFFPSMKCWECIVFRRPTSKTFR
jgi:chemotaxis-related protein WspD